MIEEVKIEKIRISYENTTTVVEGTRYTYPDGTKHFIKFQTYCSLCNIEGDNFCTEEANCLNISLAEEMQAKNKEALQEIRAKILPVRIMGIGIIATGMMIGTTKFWHFKKGDIIRNHQMIEDGALVEYEDGKTKIIFNSDLE